MSSLTSKCHKYYVPYIYDEDDLLITTGSECETEEGAIQEAQGTIRNQVEEYGRYCWAEIKTIVRPLYGE